MTQYKSIRYEVSDLVGLLTLNRPDRVNAIDETMIIELEEFWNARRHDDATRVIIMCGAGDRGFCSGLDLKETAGQLLSADLKIIYRLQARISRLLLKMRQAPQPIIGAIHGAAVGGGLSFALGCCVRIVSRDVRFGAAYINIGLGGADCGSSYFLPRMIGAGRAYEFMLPAISWTLRPHSNWGWSAELSGARHSLMKPATWQIKCVARIRWVCG